ncbi:hypothetical protein GCM10017783_25850 [Deinococcus piscis]|uniref:Uncharacterized protein n=1 Tax=Deinococcus piscis TaxID=394230 RepID=A0ABQ3KEI5_9DEIO|nr:hypothetical protein [Deinococcus piscis]GHG12660.1 hypothetical protein GCM10017783_25850 [Deinococcus piscis]
MTHPLSEAEQAILLVWADAALPEPWMSENMTDFAELESKGLATVDLMGGESYRPTPAGLLLGRQLAGQQTRLDSSAVMELLQQATPGTWKGADTSVYALNEEGSNRIYANIQPGQHEEKRTSDSELRADAKLMAQAKELAFWGLEQSAALARVRALAEEWANAEKDVSGSGSYLATRAFGTHLLSVLEEPSANVRDPATETP